MKFLTVLWIIVGHYQCEDPGIPVNGYRLGDEFLEGRKVSYKCKAGYWLNGTAEPVCNGTGYGNWSDEKPFCESKPSDL